MEEGNIKTNIVYIEDNEDDWKKTKSIFDEINKKNNNKYSFFPNTREDFYHTRNNAKNLVCIKDFVKRYALNRLNKICNNADILLLDYRLVSGDELFAEGLSGIDVYKKLDSNVNSLIYTNSNEIEIERIQDEIKSNSLEDRMEVIKKPRKSLFKQELKGQKELYQEYTDYLNSHLEKAISKNH